ncbi:hypothetical protein C4D60_Mb04t23590 [Musa balbisiana]|uniref:Uncharacterized protein n=1 Tax=Musa balbisiana TaxID=52838 RepID=A0A4S8KE47_MUSBA|nr:hypothetical protein C4D60_Mb04t23590 [Musa balbisiana]
MLEKTAPMLKKAVAISTAMQNAGEISQRCRRDCYSEAGEISVACIDFCNDSREISTAMLEKSDCCSEAREIFATCSDFCSDAGEISTAMLEKSARLEIVVVIQCWSLVVERATEFSAEDFDWQGSSSRR